MLAPFAPHMASEMWTAFADNASKASSEFDWSKPVLEQRWPQVDKDYLVDMRCFVNNQECCKPIMMPRSEQDGLTESIALGLLQQNEAFLKYYGACQILKTTFEHYPGISSTIRLLVEEQNKKKPPVT